MFDPDVRSNQTNIFAQKEWFTIENIAQVDSPSLVVYLERVRDNIRRAVLLAGGAEKLRPHMKTTKCAQVCRMMMDEGIRQFKCATIAEAELLAMAGAPDVLLAYQPVGPKVDRLLRLIEHYPGTQFSCLVDHLVPAKSLAAAATRLALTVPVYVDINVGMNRTGIVPGDEAVELYEVCHRQKGLEAAGFHVYDGHILASDMNRRTAICEAAIEPVEEMRQILQAKGYGKPSLIAGGTPTFLIHAQHADRQCSPGTFVYWDAGYGAAFPELPFIPAALVFSRVVSSPDANTITLDLGHKSVAAENDVSRRITFLNAPDAALFSQSEEHGMVKLPEGHHFSIGDILYGLPFHICPTVALFEKAHVVIGNKIVDEWETRARDRSIMV